MRCWIILYIYPQVFMSLYFAAIFGIIKSKENQTFMRYFKCYSKQDILSITHVRRFETRLGERLQAISNTNNLEQSLEKSTAKFVLVGIPEDIGVKANYGGGGTDSVWRPFLDSFVNIQSNDFLEGGDILLNNHLYGHPKMLS